MPSLVDTLGELTSLVDTLGELGVECQHILPRARLLLVSIALCNAVDTTHGRLVTLLEMVVLVSPE